MGKNLFLENPIFICGHRRSGTTLLTCLIENHPQLVVYPTDSGFFYAFYPLYESPEYSHQERIDQIVDFCIGSLDEFLRVSFSETIINEINFPLAAFQNEFREWAKKTKCTSKELLVTLINVYYNQYRCPQKPVGWVEKTTSSEIYAVEALKWFPKAKFIHVVRDPRDNWGSLKSGWEVRFKYQNDQIDRLMHSMIERGKFGFELSVRNQERFGKDVYKVIRYEDLVSNIREVMEDVCDFMGVSFSDNVLSPTICGKAWQGNNYNNTKFNGPSSNNVNRWLDRITEEEARLIEYHFEDYMRVFDYPIHSRLDERIDAAVNHYKWYNYAQSYSFTTTQNIIQPKQETK